jgi:hypothetical protein
MKVHVLFSANHSDYYQKDNDAIGVFSTRKKAVEEATRLRDEAKAIVDSDAVWELRCQHTRYAFSTLPDEKEDCDYWFSIQEWELDGPSTKP